MSRTLQATGLSLLAVGGTFLAVVSLSSQIREILYPISTNVFTALLALGIILATAGLILVLVGHLLLLQALAAAVQNITKRIDDARRKPHFDCTPARLEDLPLIYEFAVRRIGPDVSEIERMRSWQERNSQVFWVLREAGDRGKEERSSRPIRAYFCLLPITRPAVRDLERKLLTGATILPDHIVRPNGRKAAIYIGAIAADNSWSSGIASAHLITTLRHSLKRQIPIYARPMSDEGLKMLKRRGFRPIDPDGQWALGDIYRLDYTAASKP